MSIELVRIDDRFIHGQVVMGWCPFLKPDHIILCDDEIARSDWESQIYKEAAADYKTSVCSVQETATLVKQQALQDCKLFVIVESPAVVVQLLNLQVPIKKVNVGGMHYQPGKRKVTDFIYIDDTDLEKFRILASAGVQLLGVDVPTGKTIDLVKALHLQ